MTEMADYNFFKKVQNARSHLSKGIKAIVFDVDETLSSEISWDYLTKRLGANLEEHHKNLELLRTKQITLEESINRLVKMWDETGNNNIDVITQIFDSMPLQPGTEYVIEKLQSKYKVAIISGSLDKYVESIARRLKISEYYANSKLILEDNKIKTFIYHPDEDKEKLKNFQIFLKRNNLKAKEVAIVADGANDKELFKKCGVSILVYNDRNFKYFEMVDAVVKTLVELTSIFVVNKSNP